ncbi:MAG: protein-L-isoaspartate(D-aspartate) O-methyltransferase [Bacteroidota bacterium]
MPDDRRYQRQREQLVEQLRSKGITDERVLKAIGSVPRHLFVDQALRRRAYEDEALPIGLKQTISQPFTVAYQTMLLAPKPNERILEIGTGSGYQAAVLCEMGARVFSVERHRALLERTKRLLDELGYRVVARHGDGSLGWPSYAPFDGIVVTAGAADVPNALLEQLRMPEETRAGGRLIIPVGSPEGQVMNRIIRSGPGEFEREEMSVFRFVPLVGGGPGAMEQDPR